MDKTPQKPNDNAIVFLTACHVAAIIGLMSWAIVLYDKYSILEIRNTLSFVAIAAAITLFSLTYLHKK